jgi:hypothetical protein
MALLAARNVVAVLRGEAAATPVNAVDPAVIASTLG